MSEVVSKQSLDALANLAFTELKIRADSGTRAKAQFNLAGSSGEALYKLTVPDVSGTSEAVRTKASAFTSGMEFGLAVAAAVLTHQHDLDAVCQVLKAELKDDTYAYQELCAA